MGSKEHPAANNGTNGPFPCNHIHCTCCILVVSSTWLASPCPFTHGPLRELQDHAWRTSSFPSGTLASALKLHRLTVPDAFLVRHTHPTDASRRSSDGFHRPCRKILHTGVWISLPRVVLVSTPVVSFDNPSFEGRVGWFSTLRVKGTYGTCPG